MYRKMISYIYEYQNGVKGKNVGFVRVTVQNETYKINLQLENNLADGTELSVYGFVRGSAGVEMALFGNCLVEMGMGKGSYIGNTATVWKNYRFLDMNGFLIVEKEAQKQQEIPTFYGSQWDEEPMVWNDFFAEHTEMEEVSEAGASQSVQIVEAEKKESQPLHMQSTEVDEHSVTEELESAEETEILKETEIQNEFEMVREQESEAKEETESEPCLILEREQKSVEQMELASKEAMSFRLSEDQQEKKEPLENAQDQWALFEQRKNDLQKQYATMKKEMSEEARKNIWSTGEELLKKFPKLNPFFDKEVQACVRMEPKDLGCFPMEFWFLANNSFLLHGYYSYRHLLFMKMQNREEYQYAIGVPGNCDYREKFMANMFGFEQFKGVQNKEKAGFGYWWVRLY